MLVEYNKKLRQMEQEDDELRVKLLQESLFNGQNRKRKRGDIADVPFSPTRLSKQRRFLVPFAQSDEDELLTLPSRQNPVSKVEEEEEQTEQCNTISRL
jgi:hypothetical protein